MQQQRLPFEEAEGTRAERRNLLGLALMRIRCNAEIAKLCEWVFNVTHGGASGELVRTYEQLADRPWGLCCSRQTARRAVAIARDAGILEVEEQRYVTTGQKANALRIDWPGIRRLLGIGPIGPSHQDAGAEPDSDEGLGVSDPALQNGPPALQIGAPPVQSGAPPVQIGAPYKEYNLSSSSSYSIDEGVDGGEVEAKRGEIIATAREVARLAWRDARLGEDDRRYVLGLAILAHCRFSPAWLLDGARAAKRHATKPNPRGFLHNHLASRGEATRGAADPKLALDLLLASVADHVDAWPRRRAAAVASE